MSDCEAILSLNPEDDDEGGMRLKKCGLFHSFALLDAVVVLFAVYIFGRDEM